MRKKRDVNGIILSIILFGNLIGINWIAKGNQIERIFPLKHPFQKWSVYWCVRLFYFILFYLGGKGDGEKILTLPTWLVFQEKWGSIIA